MNKNRFIHAVLPSQKKVDYPEPTLAEKDRLEAELIKRGLDIQLGKALKGGVVSQIYEAVLDDKRLVVKHTENLTPFDPTEFFISKEGHNVDTKILKLFAKSDRVNVPEVIHFFPDITATIMEDVREDGYELLSDIITNKKLKIDSADKVGKALANLAKESRSWKEFKTNESAEQSIYERGLELRLAYPNTQKEYKELEKEFTENSKYWVWPDGHPKNVFVNEKGEVLFIDFGRSHWGDQRYMLPNFLSHIGLYSLAGFIDRDIARKYISKAIKEYGEHEEVNDEIFCKYFTMEVLHRANGKWIDGIESREQKLRAMEFGMRVFDEEVYDLEGLLEILCK